MIKFKIFMGTYIDMADAKINAWLTQNPDIEIIKMKYQQARYGDHSICIMYKEGG